MSILLCVIFSSVVLSDNVVYAELYKSLAFSCVKLVTIVVGKCVMNDDSSVAFSVMVSRKVTFPENSVSLVALSASGSVVMTG